MKMQAFLIVIIIFFLFAGTVNAAPQWSGNTTFPGNGSFFGPDQQYNFTINWTSSLDIDTVWIEHNFTGPLQNSTMSNTSADIYTYNTSLIPGTYVWRSYANDSSGTNATAQFTYEVTKGPTFIRMFLNGTDGKREYEPNDIANLTVDLFTFKKYNHISYFEELREDNASLLENWFYTGWENPAVEQDTLTWEWSPVSNDSYRGSRSFLYNLTASDFSGYVQSRVVNLTSDNDYRVEFFTKTNITSTGSGNWIALYWDHVNTSNFWYDDACGYVIRWNNDDINTYTYACSDPDDFRVNRTNASNGWEKITIDIFEVPSSKYPDLKGIVFYLSEWSNTLEGEVFIDDFSVQDMDSTSGKTVNLTLNGVDVSNGSSPLTNITILTEFGQNNVTGLFLGDENFTASNKTNIAQVGYATNLVVTSDASSYAQSSTSTYRFFANITANYTNVTTGNAVSGATCTVSTNITSDTFTMNFSSSNQIYNLTLDTRDLYDTVSLSVTCSGNATHLSQINSTVFYVSFQAHYANTSNLTLAGGNVNTNTTLNKTRSNIGFILSEQVNATGTGDIITFYFVDVGTNLSLDRNYEIGGNVTIRGNISVSNTSLLVHPCFQLRNSEANVIAERCGTQTALSANNTYELLEFNVSASDIRPSSTNYITVTWKYNNSASNPMFNLSYNISNPALEIKSFRPFDIVTKDNNPEQLDSSFTIGPNQALNISLITNITLNNTGSVRARLIDHVYHIPASANITNVIVNNSLGNTISSTLNISDKSVKFTTEYINPGKVINETISWTCVECLSQSEIVIQELMGTRVWNVTVNSLLLQGDLENVTVSTNYIARGALAGWTFSVTLTNSSGSFDISNQTTLSGNNLFMPVTSLSSVTYQINATGLANGQSCSNNNQCGTGLCCNSACASTCIITETVSTGGGVLIIQEYDIEIESPSRIDIYRSENKTFRVGVSNPNNETSLNSIRLSIEGYPQTLITIEPESIDNLDYNQTKYFDISVSAPLYIKSGEYNVTVTAEGIANKTNETVQASAEMIFFIHKVLESNAIESVTKAEQAVKEMENAGFTTEKINNSLEQAKQALENGDFDRAKLLGDEIVSKKEKAFIVFGLLQEIERNIQQAKYNDFDVSETEKMYALALAAFEREDYDRAEERANSALLIFATETMGVFNLIRFIYDYWWAITITVFILLIAAAVAYRRLSLLLVKKGLQSLRGEEETIKKLIENVKREYFEKRTLTTKEYEHSIESYENMLIKIKKKRVKLRSRLIGMLNYSSILETFKREDMHLQNLIAETQKKYFKEKSITKRAYEKTIKELKSEKAEIQKNIEYARAKESERGNRILNLLKM